MGGCFACMHVYAPGAYRAQGGQKGVLYPLGLELQQKLEWAPGDKSGARTLLPELLAGCGLDNPVGETECPSSVERGWAQSKLVGA